MNSLDKLREELEKVIHDFREQGDRHKWMYRRGQGAVIALTATTTIVAGDSI
jgi:hypothetical protein